MGRTKVTSKKVTKLTTYIFTDMVSRSIVDFTKNDMPNEIRVVDAVYDMVAIHCRRDPLAIEEWYCEIHRDFLNFLLKNVEKMKRASPKEQARSVTDFAMLMKIPGTKTDLSLTIKINRYQNDSESFVYIDIEPKKEIVLDLRSMENNIIERVISRPSKRSRSDNEQ